MQITHIDFYNIRIPFKFSVNHNLKKRQESNALLVAIELDNHFVGYGEGAPRKYVTDESMEVIFPKLEKVKQALLGAQFNKLEDIHFLMSEVQHSCSYPSVLAALEIAFLDLLGQVKNCSISDFFPNSNVQLTTYSAVLPLLDISAFEKMLNIVKGLEISQVKVKIGSENDERNLELVREILGEDIDIRADANRAWSYAESIEKINRLSRFNLSSIEEPIYESPMQFLPDLADKIEPKLLLDESLFTLEHAQFFAARIPADRLLFNLKLSKCGGLFNTSHIHQFAQSKGIECQLGCNVGETAILSAAGRIFAQTHALKHLEGSYAPFFMEDDLVEKPISFGKKGMAKVLLKSGLGIQIQREKLEKYNLQFTKIAF